ncbi:hypothetical protein [Telmatospirillum siberiense]|uniref:Uncharacterized protein n=1 Tax=Telmatospirillum siberiense TaxID=382514 RepID=A0A2N3Q1T4_9PROT|nr:hypothetical protein [Telmatospirillum siberiense]PKU26612.1 hypothetical protein CWS72_01920 [Telmatospirillum siberiense]
MPFTFTKNTVTAKETCTVEDALPLLEFLQSHPHAKINLGPCDHLHTAILQVLLAARPQITQMPGDPPLAHWLTQTLGSPARKTAK